MLRLLVSSHAKQLLLIYCLAHVVVTCVVKRNSLCDMQLSDVHCIPGGLPQHDGSYPLYAQPTWFCFGSIYTRKTLVLTAGCSAGPESEDLSRQPSSMVDGFENFNNDDMSDPGYPGKSPRLSETSEVSQ